MPDEEGSQTADVPDTSLHAYGDGREEDADPGSRGITGDQGTGDAGSYQEGGHDTGADFAATATDSGDESSAGAQAGAGSGAMDPNREAADGGRSDTGDTVDPESPGRADAQRPPRGAPPA
ncbi:MAG: hypothetical protein QOE27_2354 [Solirubrobacteraceae bacterium]|nr:hypothetical protein [Solirubrobacteraceae bacterium]MEA2301751.1 hypothetical protein [Solirubrobacteraceae bacterium]MEA2354797.1 hypothetical protein [Solirubrobacteraceae bacterium]